MRGTLLHSLLELADATSQNLAFAHRDDVHVSYGEETITETNLLELRRRHPTSIRLSTFSRKKESKNGADWEWHVIGRKRRRVQAKRVQKNGILKIAHKIKGSGDEQIKLLIKDAKKHGCKPVYCLYASEAQRSVWKASVPTGTWEEFEYGCLLASAQKVKRAMPKNLGEIEKDCIPWHYLVSPRRFSRTTVERSLWDKLGLAFLSSALIERVVGSASEDDVDLSEFPTIDELNQEEPPSRKLEGILDLPSTAGRQELDETAYRERGIRMVLELGVSDLPLATEPTPDSEKEG